jgi:hypothetical protein
MRLQWILTLVFLAMLAAMLFLDVQQPSSTHDVTPTVTPDWTYEGDHDGDRVGTAVAIAGDVNSDGRDDVIIGAPRDQDAVFREGVVALFFGTASGASNSPDWTYGSGQQGARLGDAVIGAGDVDGDGRADILVGAPEYNEGESKEGAVFLFYGESIVGLTGEPDWVFHGGQQDANLGAAVSSGDINDDGYSDLIVGVPGYIDTILVEGATFVFYGGEDGPGDTPDRILLGSGANGRFGAAVGAGDVDGDGCDDVIVGAPGAGGVGGAFLFTSADGIGLQAVASWTAVGSQADGKFGFAVAGGGDVNGDGYGDVLVGAPGQEGGQIGAGAAYLFCGGPGGLEASPRWSAFGDQAYEEFGAAVAMAGDVNDDGYDDAVVGAPQFVGDHSIEGGAFLFHGTTSGLFPFASWRAEGNKAGTEFGSAVGGGGDMNNDGAADLVVGAPLYKKSDDNSCGAAFGYLGPMPWQGFRTYLPLIEHRPQ